MIDQLHSLAPISQTVPPSALWEGTSLQAISIAAQEELHEGLLHLQSGDAAQAVAALSRCVEHEPEFGDGHVFLGIAHALNHSIYPALDHLEEATRLRQDSFAAHYTLAQLNFKLRIPQKGYEAAERARQCAATVEQRRMLTQLLREERARDRNGIGRPWFNKAMPARFLFLAGSLIAAAGVAFVAHLR